MNKMTRLDIDDFKKLNRDEAIKLHRTMWNLIAEEKCDKREALYILGYSGLLNMCFCCQYSFEQTYNTIKMCEKCPIDWGYTGNRACVQGLYGKWIKEKNKTKKSEIARKIAELKEKQNDNG